MDQVKNQTQNKNYIFAVGRRKEAVARVRIFKGKGEIIVNTKPIDTYFPGSVAKVKWQKPFLVTNLTGKYHATIKVAGSGKSSQLDAIVHGLSRAFTAVDGQLKKSLKEAGLLTRDPRVKERRKYGLAQKARKGKQSPKR